MIQNKIIFVIILVLLLFITFIPVSSTKSSQNITPVPVAHWSFNNFSNNTAQDDSGNNLTATLVNTTIVNGISGTGVYFNGNNSYIIIPDSNVFHVYELTVSFWFYLSSTTTYARLIGKGSGVNETLEISIYQDPNKQYTIYYGSHDELNCLGKINLANTWHKITFVYANVNESLYLDNISVGSSLSSPLPNNTDPLVLGINPVGIPTPFNGVIDDLSFYNQSLSDSTIFSMYQSEEGLITNTSPLSTSYLSSIAKTSNISLVNNKSFFDKNSTIDSLFILFLIVIASAIIILFVINRKNSEIEKVKPSNFDFNKKKKTKFKLRNQAQKLSEKTLELMEEIIEENKE